MSLLALLLSYSVAAVAWASRDLLQSNMIMSDINGIHSRHLSNFQFPKGSSGRVVIDKTMRVEAGETFDGDMKTYTFSKKKKNSKDPIMRVYRGATLKNMIIEGRAGNGINFFGNNVVDNVWFTDAEGGKAFRIVHNAADFDEFGISFKMTNCGVRNSRTALQVHAGGMKISVDNLKMDNVYVGLYFCQKCKFPFNVAPSTVKFTNSVFRYGSKSKSRVVEADAGDPTLITARGQPDKAILDLGPGGLQLFNKVDQRVCLGHDNLCKSHGGIVNF